MDSYVSGYLKNVYFILYVLITLLNLVNFIRFYIYWFTCTKHVFYSICVYLLGCSFRTGPWSILFTDTMHIEFWSSLIICLSRTTLGKYTSKKKGEIMRKFEKSSFKSLCDLVQRTLIIKNEGSQSKNKILIFQ